MAMVIYVLWRFLTVLLAPALVAFWAFWVVWDAKGRPCGFGRFVVDGLRSMLDIRQ